jgi:soluble lytic murein transglycosylase-like protein
MTSAPIIRSAALQRALGQATGKQTKPVQPSFASTLANAQSSNGSATSSSSTSSSLPRLPSSRSTSSTSFTPVSFRPNAAAAAQTGPIPYKDLIDSSARKYGIDPALLAGLVKAESNFNPNAQSGVGAKGLTQLMDATAHGLGVSNSFDPAQALDGGAKFLSGLLKQFNGDEKLALAAYNAGPGAVRKFGGIPPYQETQRYVPKVLGFVTQFRRIWADSNGIENA